MGRRAHAIFAVCVALLVQPRDFSAQEITVRLIDIHSGRPLANEPLEINFEDAHGAETSQRFEARIGADGFLKFPVPKPTPSQITVIQRPDLMRHPLYACSINQSLDIQLLIKGGVVLLCSIPPRGCPCKIGKQVSQITNTPGELVLFARHLTWWEKLRGHLSRIPILE
jgi:hypothetical protein